MTKKKKHLPIQDENISKEDSSRIEFERLIHPWKFVSFDQSHASIDGVIETSYEDSTQTRLISGRRFSVQLKLRKKSKVKDGNVLVRVEVSSLNSWVNAFEPVMFAVFHVPDNCFYYVFIDDELVHRLNKNNPNWIAQKSVNIQIPISNKINENGLLKIDEYLSAWKRKNVRVIAPGTYFEIKGKLDSLFKDSIASLEKNKIEYGKKELNKLINNAKLATYTVTVVGETSVGKSTLVNSLISKKISPMDKVPTTGIPCTFQPNSKEFCEIIFKDGKHKKGEASDEFLRDYVTQKENPDNEKGVSLATVHLIDNKLEKGLAYCDVPGLNDPDEKIEKIAKSAIFTSSAIIYIIDATPMLGGGFYLRGTQVKDIKELRFRRDRLFLVVNKVDMLSKEQCKELNEFLNNELKKHGIDKCLSHPPILISAKKAYQKRINGSDNNDSVKELENHLWDYLLANNKTGLDNLIALANEYKDELRKVSNLLKSRMIDSEKRQKLRKDLIQTKSEINQINRYGSKRKNELLKWMNQYIDSSTRRILYSVENWLYSFPSDNSLPSSINIKKYLQDQAILILSDIYEKVNDELDTLYGDTNNWVKNKLSQTEIEINKYSDPDFQVIGNFNSLVTPISKNFFENRPKAVNLVEEGILFVGDLFSDIYNFLEQLIIGKEEVRAKQIQKVLEKSNYSYSQVFNKSKIIYTKYVNKQYERILHQIIDRTNVYIGNLSDQLNELQDELSSEEKRNYTGFLDKKNKLVNEADRLLIMLDVTNSIQFNENKS